VAEMETGQRGGDTSAPPTPSSNRRSARTSQGQLGGDTSALALSPSLRMLGASARPSPGGGSPRVSQSGSPRVSQSGSPRVSQSGSPGVSQSGSMAQLSRTGSRLSQHSGVSGDGAGVSGGARLSYTKAGVVKIGLRVGANGERRKVQMGDAATRAVSTAPAAPAAGEAPAGALDDQETPAGHASFGSALSPGGSGAPVDPRTPADLTAAGGAPLSGDFAVRAARRESLLLLAASQEKSAAASASADPGTPAALAAASALSPDDVSVLTVADPLPVDLAARRLESLMAVSAAASVPPSTGGAGTPRLEQSLRERQGEINTFFGSPQ